MNKWTFSGGLGDDCKVEATRNGKTICRFSVAVNSGYGDNKKTTWVNCAILDKRAEGGLPQYLVKGQKVLIDGECTLEKWQAQDGTERQALKVIVGEIELIGERKQQAQQAPQLTQQQAQPAVDNFVPNSDIPF